MGQTVGIDESDAKEMTDAEILMQMAPGVNTRKRDSDVKPNSSKLLGSFKNIGKEIGRASNLFTLKESRMNLTSSKMSLGGNRDRTSLSATGVGQQDESQVESNERITENDSAKNASAKNSFGIIEEEDEYDEEQL